jgi:hypothetical protein
MGDVGSLAVTTGPHKPAVSPTSLIEYAILTIPVPMLSSSLKTALEKKSALASVDPGHAHQNAGKT